MLATRYITLSLVGVSLAVAAAVAVPPGARQGQQGPPPGERPEPPAPPFERMAAHVVRSVDLTEDQILAIDELVAEHLAAAEANAGRRGEVRAIVQELRAARDSGDDEAAALLMAELQEIRAQPRPHEVFLDDVEALLTEEQLEQFATIEWPKPRRGQGPRGPINLDRLQNVLVDQLELTEEQQAQLGDVITAAKAELETQRAAHEDLRKQFRDARAAGDEALLNQLREQMRTQRGEHRAFMDSLADEIRALLNDDQAAQFDQLRERMQKRMHGQRGRGMGPRAERGGPGGGDAPRGRQFLRILAQLDLTDDQRTAVRTVMQNHRANRPGPNASEEERIAHRAALVTAIKEILTAEQIEKLEQLLEQRGRPGRVNRSDDNRGGAGQRGRPVR